MVDRFTFLIQVSCENERSLEQLVDISEKYIPNLSQITSVFPNYFGTWECSVDTICVQQLENMLSNTC